jgi:hypothetical protein
VSGPATMFQKKLSKHCLKLSKNIFATGCSVRVKSHGRLISIDVLFAIHTNVASSRWMYMYGVHFIRLTTAVVASHELGPPSVHNKCSEALQPKLIEG